MQTFEKLCEENYTFIYKYVFLMTNDKPLTEDVVQEVFTVAYEKGEVFLEHPNKEAFLCTTARNMTYSALRKSARRNEQELEENMLVEQRDLLEQIEAEEEQQFDEMEYVQQVLSELSEEQKVLYEKYYVQHYSMREIARQMDLKESAVRMRYLRLRKQIRSITAGVQFGQGGEQIGK